MKGLVLALVLSAALAAPAAAQTVCRVEPLHDDCPPGAVRNPPVSPLDEAYMEAAVKASFRGRFGREPSMVDGAGKDDGCYYVRASNHYGPTGDGQCHAGWSGYWESWLQNGEGNISLVQTPARFLPNVTAPAPAPTPIPAPAPAPSEGVLLPTLTAIAARLEQLYALEAEQSRADGEAHAAIHQNISDGRAENRSIFSTVGDHWRSITAIAGPFVTYATCRATGKCGS